MAKRRLQKLLDLSCENNNNSFKTSRNHEQNITPSFVDIIASSTIVFDENSYSGQNIDFTENEVLAIPIEEYFSFSNEDNLDQADHNVFTEESGNINNVAIITLPLELNNSIVKSDIQETENIDNNMEQVQEVAQNIKNNNCNIKPRQKLRMNGEDYIGYQRKGNVLSQDVTRSARKIQATCNSTFCKKSNSRFCHTFEENQKSEIFLSFWKASWDEKKTLVSSIVTQINTKRNTENHRRSNTCTIKNYEHIKTRHHYLYVRKCF